MSIFKKTFWPRYPVPATLFIACTVRPLIKSHFKKANQSIFHFVPLEYLKNNPSDKILK